EDQHEKREVQFEPAVEGKEGKGPDTHRDKRDGKPGAKPVQIILEAIVPGDDVSTATAPLVDAFGMFHPCVLACERFTEAFDKSDAVFALVRFVSYAFFGFAYELHPVFPQFPGFDGHSPVQFRCKDFSAFISGTGSYESKEKLTEGFKRISIDDKATRLSGKVWITRFLDAYLPKSICLVLGIPVPWVFELKRRDSGVFEDGIDIDMRIMLPDIFDITPCYSDVV
ncbi:MAG TPA: hypothetical protein P5146_10850, partial [Desulfomonilia bacterium]|nr:hypothetical protein [Desulfomonilia bacterium]